MTQTLFHQIFNPLNCKNRISQFDSVPLVTLRLKFSRHQKRKTSRKFLQNKVRDVESIVKVCITLADTFDNSDYG